MNNAQELFEHYKAVRARLGAAPKPVFVNIPRPEPKIQKPIKRDIIDFYPENVIPFKPNKTPDELYNSYAVEKTRLPYLREIVDVVCAEFGIGKINMLSSRRTGDLVLPRAVLYYLCRTCSFKSLPEIGRALGGRDHSTILHGVKKIETLMLQDNDLHYRINDLRRRLMVENLSHRYWGA